MEEYLDTNVFIYYLTNHPAYGAKAGNFFERCREGKINVCTSVYTMAEINGVLRAKRLHKKQIVQALEVAINLNIKFIPLRAENMVSAIATMSKGFSFGDSVHIETMREAGINTIISSDPDFERAGFKRVFL